MIKKIILIVIILQLSLPVYCEQTEPGNNKNLEQLIVGIFPRRDPAVTVKIFTPLIKQLEKELQIPVKLETAKDFTSFLKRLKNRRYDLVHFNQYHYIQANKNHAYDAIVQNEEFNQAKISGAIYVRKDSQITQLSQLKNRTILFGGGKSAMMSYIVPRYLLQQAGVKQGDYKELYAVSPPNAVLATYLNQVDAGGAGEIVINLPMIKKKIDTSQLQLIAISEPLAHLPWAIKREFNTELKTRLQAVLTGLKSTEQGRVVLKKARLTAFNPASDSDYDKHREIVKQVINEQ